MKRHLARQRSVRSMLLLAACMMPVVNCCAAARAADRYPQHAGGATAWAGKMRHSLQRARLADAPPAQSAAYFGDVPMTVVGVYGATMLDMLSGGPLVLVKWPNDCCSSRQRWHTGHGPQARSAPANSKADRAHTFFLWPES
ncbi:MAG TPA: hypothetical protein VGM85_19265 [Paraburkholderia sp.]